LIAVKRIEFAQKAEWQLRALLAKLTARISRSHSPDGLERNVTSVGDL
jgi:hypothetical protein